MKFNNELKEKRSSYINTDENGRKLYVAIEDRFFGEPSMIEFEEGGGGGEDTEPVG